MRGSITRQDRVTPGEDTVVVYRRRIVHRICVRANRRAARPVDHRSDPGSAPLRDNRNARSERRDLPPGCPERKLYQSCANLSWSLSVSRSLRFGYLVAIPSECPAPDRTLSIALPITQPEREEGASVPAHLVRQSKQKAARRGATNYQGGYACGCRTAPVTAHRSPLTAHNNVFSSASYLPSSIG
jgi:hypothetical protein